MPLARFGGLTSFEVASLGFACHRTQLGRTYSMKVGGDTDNSLFGLYRLSKKPSAEGKLIRRLQD